MSIVNVKATTRLELNCLNFKEVHQSVISFSKFPWPNCYWIDFSDLFELSPELNKYCTDHSSKDCKQIYYGFFSKILVQPPRP